MQCDSFIDGCTMYLRVQENMEEDGERVNMLFEKAPQVGIRVQVYSLGFQP